MVTTPLPHQLRFVLLPFILVSWSHYALTQDHMRCNCTPVLFCENFTIHAYNQIDNHPVFSREMVLDTGCANKEFYPKIKVVADGTQATLVKIENVRCNCGPLDENARIFVSQINEDGDMVGNSQPDDYGGFIFDSFAGNTTVFRFQHPTRLPGPGLTRSFFVTIYQQGTDDNYGRFRIEVYRPPVIFVHGLWSDESAFDVMYNAFLNSGEYEDYQLYKADYSSTHASSFSTNDLVVRNAVTQIIDNCRYNGLSAGKVNIVAHSMGGLLSRQYLSAPYYPSRNDINRLITCNTPHQGSQMANFLLDTAQYGQYLSVVLGAFGMDCYGGAVDNLRVDSPSLIGVQIGTQPPDLQYHSIITVLNIPSYLRLFSAVMTSGTLEEFFQTICYQCGVDFFKDIFDEDDSDVIVAAGSQAGSLSGFATSVYNNQVHIGSVGNDEVINNALTLLDFPITSTSYATSYAAQFLNYDLDVFCLPLWEANSEVRDADAVSLHIDSPASGTSVNGGEVVTVNYSAEMLDSVVIAMSFRADSIALIANSAAAGSVDFVVPKNLLGNQTLVAIGFGDDKKIKTMDSIHLQVNTTAQLTGLSFYPPIMFLDRLDSLPFKVTGYYNDGVVRDLTYDPGLLFDFSYGFATRTSHAFIRMDSTESDTLRIRSGAMVSPPVLIQKSFSGNAPTTFLCEAHLGPRNCADTIPSNAELVSVQFDSDAGQSCFYVCQQGMLNLEDNPNGPHGGNDIYVDQNGIVTISSMNNNVVARAPSVVNLLPGSEGTNVVCMPGVSVFQNGVQIFPCTCDAVTFDTSYFHSFCNTVAVEEPKVTDIELNIYPVPASSFVTICLQNSETSIERAYILNGEGKIMMSLPGPQGKYLVDVSSFTPGLYFVRAETKKGQWFRKMVVQ